MKRAKARILLVEDSATYAQLATWLLASLGCEVIHGETGEDALRLAREVQPDLILMDTHLPGMDGLEAVRRLRDDPRIRDLPTVGMTAELVGGDQRDASRAAGFDGYIQKPIDRGAFRTVLVTFDLLQPAGEE